MLLPAFSYAYYVPMINGWHARLLPLVVHSNRQCTRTQVLLQNCHLATDWLATLAAHIHAFGSDADDVHQDFRLWLTSAPTPQFPVSVLRACVKVSVEPCDGLRESVVSSLTELPEDLQASCDGSSTHWRSLVHAIVLFHGVAQERRSYGPLGWIVPYDFAHTDLVCSLRTAHNLLHRRSGDQVDDASAPVPWAAITHILGQIHYGGRVTDGSDRRLLDALIRRHVGAGTLQLGSAEHASASAPESLQSMLEHARGLPDDAPPELLSLHSSAASRRDLQHGQALVRAALRLQPHALPEVAGSGALPRHDSGAAVLQRVEDILSSLPAALELGKASQVRITCRDCS